MPSYARSRSRSTGAGTARWMDLRYPGTCTAGEPLAAGTRAFFDPRDRSVTCTDLDHADAAGLTRNEWVGSPVSGGYERRLSETRIASFVGEYTPRVSGRRTSGRRSTVSYRCTHVDFPCCGCER